MIKYILFFALCITYSVTANISFNSYFHNSTMRIDYHHTGDSKIEIVSFDKIYQYPKWAGSTKYLIDNFDNGKYYYKIFDAKTKKLIYSKGFDSYFGEYQSSGPATKGVKKAFHETAIIPFPKQSVIFTLEKRDAKNKLKQIFTAKIDTDDVSILKEHVADPSIIIDNTHISGDPQKKVDLIIIGDGYTSDEIAKFKHDMQKFKDAFFSLEPYKSQKNKFNVRGVLKPSLSSGVDQPRANIYANTSVDLTFNSMGSERYLLTENNKALRDIAAHLPYDAICIMANSNRYGGGGIYNFYCTFTSDNQWFTYLVLHEFGHSFSGLADEYYTSSVAYDNFFTIDIEPVEPNITALLDKKNVKWKHLLSPNIMIPTVWEKPSFDKASNKWQTKRSAMNKKVSDLKRTKASAADIKKSEKEYARLDKENAETVDKYLQNCKFARRVGVFEGAGYLSKGLYRSQIDCIMFSKGHKPYCAVCEDHIKKVIDQYSD